MFASAGNVFPTGVGMNRPPSDRTGRLRRVPHGRGDEPEALATLGKAPMCSPRAWG